MQVVGQHFDRIILRLVTEGGCEVEEHNKKRSQMDFTVASVGVAQGHCKDTGTKLF